MRTERDGFALQEVLTDHVRSLKEGWLYGRHRGRTPRCGNGLARKTLVQRSGKDLSTSRRGGLNEGLKVRFEP